MCTSSNALAQTFLILQHAKKDIVTKPKCDSVIHTQCDPTPTILLCLSRKKGRHSPSREWGAHLSRAAQRDTPAAPLCPPRTRAARAVRATASLTNLNLIFQTGILLLFHCVCVQKPSIGPVFERATVRFWSTCLTCDKALHPSLEKCPKIDQRDSSKVWNTLKTKSRLMPKKTLSNDAAPTNRPALSTRA